MYPGGVHQRGFGVVREAQPHFERARCSFGDFQHGDEIGFGFPAFDVARGRHDVTYELKLTARKFGHPVER